MNVFDLSAVLNLDKSGYDRGLNSAESQFSSFGSKLKSGLGTIVKVTGAALAAGGAAAFGIAKQATDAYANYEQLVGGIETLFGAQGMGLEEYAESVGQTTDQVADQYNQLLDAQNLAMANASKAYRTAGLSKNEYMQTISGFAASLKQSVSSETEAAEVADRAVTDMADNANKMGTSMESIQNAYMGFSKQNYMMLDNLKLGYGGTKTEMERLIKDASEMTKEQEDLNVAVKDGDMSFGNIVNAISVMQKHLGIAGTTSKEAGSTIQGSASAARSAWQNVLIGIADDTQDFSALINEFVSSAGTYMDNLLPRLETSLAGVGKLIEELAPKLVEKLPDLVDNVLPSFIDAAMAIIDGIIAVLPRILEALVNATPKFIDAAIKIVKGIVKALPTILKQLRQQLPKVINELFDKVGLKVKVDGLFKVFDNIGSFLKKVFEGAKKVVAPIVGSLVDVFNFLVGVFEKITANEKVMGIITGVAGAVVALVTAWKTFQAIHTAVVAAQTAINVAMNANPVMLLVTGIGLLVGALVGLVASTGEAQQSIYALSEEEQAYLDKIHEEKTAWEEAHTARQEALTNNVAEIEKTQSLWDELKKITDENGNIKQGYEDRAAVITGILSEALGEEIVIIDGQIQKYDELKESVDEVIRKKKLSALLAAGEDAYSEALINQRAQFDKVTEARNKVTAAEKDEKKAAEDLANAQAKYDEIMRTQGKHAAEVYKPTVDNLTKAHDDAKNKLDEMTAALETENAKYGDYVGTIQTYEDLVAASTSDSVEAIDSASTKFVDHVNKSEEELAKLGRNARAWGKDMMMNFAAGIGDKGYEVENAVKKVTKMVNRNLGFSEPEEGYLSNFHTYAPDMMKLWAKGIKDNAWRVMDEVKSIAGGISSGVSGIEAQSGDSSMGGASININVYGAEGQDVDKLADKVSEKIAMQYNRLRMAY